MDKVTITQSHVPFRFGDGRKVHSFISARIPIMIANTSCQVQVEIVKENIPLLLSKDSLKKAGTVLDMTNDKAIMFGKDVPLRFSTNGHYAIDIFPKGENTESQDFCEQILVFEKDVPEKTKQKQMIKIHKQFGHASAENLKRLFNNAGKLDKEIIALIDKTLQGCDTCRMYRKANPKPIVGFSWATEQRRIFIAHAHPFQKNFQLLV